MTTLRRYEINICNCEFGPHTEREEDSDGAYVVVADALAIIEALKGDNADKDGYIAELEARLADREEQVRVIDNNNDQLIGIIQARVTRIAELEAENGLLSDTVNEYEARIAELEHNALVATEEIESYRRIAKRTVDETDTIKKEVSAAYKVRVAELEEIVAEMRKHAMLMLNEIDKKDIRIAELEAELAAADAENTTQSSAERSAEDEELSAIKRFLLFRD